MVRGLYIAGTGMMTQRRRMETITNNVANSDTTAFKKEFNISHSLDEVTTRRINDTGFRSVLGRTVGPLTLGTQIDHLHIDFTQGSLEATERTTDLALIGDGFFAVQTDAGERYTKSGHFQINEGGFLTDSDGNLVLGNNGAIYVGGLNFSVDEQGGVWNENGFVDTLRVVSFADNGTLRRQGSNLFFATEPPLAAANPFTIAQGFLETSNIDVGREMVDMLAMYRTYEINQRMVTMIDETVGRAVNDIGRLR